MADESRREHIDRGMAFIPEDRQERGLVMSYDLTENGILGSQHDPPFAEGGRLDWRASRDHAESVIEQYDVRPRTPTPRRNRSLAATSRSSSSAGSSSAIRNWSWRCTRRGGRHRLHGVPPRPPARTADRGEGGASGLLEVRRSTGLSDRLAVIHEGEFTGVVDPATVTEEEIGLLMAGETLDDDSVEGLRSTTPDRTPLATAAWRRTPGQMIPSRRQMTTLRTRRWTRESHQHRV